jgi:hypothetical protein
LVSGSVFGFGFCASGSGRRFRARGGAFGKLGRGVRLWSWTGFSAYGRREQAPYPSHQGRRLVGCATVDLPIAHCPGTLRRRGGPPDPVPNVSSATTAEYVRRVTLLERLGPEIPSTHTSSGPAKRFNGNRAPITGVAPCANATHEWSGSNGRTCADLGQAAGAGGILRGKPLAAGGYPPSVLLWTACGYAAGRLLMNTGCPLTFNALRFGNRRSRSGATDPRCRTAGAMWPG